MDIGEPLRAAMTGCVLILVLMARVFRAASCVVLAREEPGLSSRNMHGALLLCIGEFIALAALIQSTRWRPRWECVVARVGIRVVVSIYRERTAKGQLRSGPDCYEEKKRAQALPTVSLVCLELNFVNRSFLLSLEGGILISLTW